MTVTTFMMFIITNTSWRDLFSSTVVFRRMTPRRRTQTANGQTIYRAAQDGIVVYAVDGYEGITADQLTADLFSKKNYQITNLQKERKVSSGDPVYKLITSETWSSSDAAEHRSDCFTGRKKDDPSEVFKR